MDKTKSSAKAVDGSVRVVINGEEFWIHPLDLKIGVSKDGVVTLKEFIESTNNNYESMIIQSQEVIDENKKLITETEQLHGEVEILRAEVAKFDKKITNIVKGVLSR